ncbi:MAG: hypothetical protein ABI947_16015 [Chloroflexota bacterium]
MTDDKSIGEFWEFDFDGWTIGEDTMYMMQLEKARYTNDLRPLFAHWARMIRHWPFALAPNKLTSYGQLDDAVHLEIIERINQGIRIPKRADGRTGGGET